jgi:GNAT superfamily N-acetyltransferase
VEKTRFLDTNFQINKIRLMTDADYENMSAFSCGVKELDDFFHFEVKECVEHHYLSAYCATNDTGEIIAAFTLMNDALMIESNSEKNDFIDDLKIETNEDVVDFLNRQTSYPAINIGHLGTVKEYQSHGIGSSIVDLVADTYSKHRLSGCQFITVDALNNDKSLKFYHKNAFSFQTNRDMNSPTRRMYKLL